MLSEAVDSGVLGPARRIAGEPLEALLLALLPRLGQATPVHTAHSPYDERWRASGCGWAEFVVGALEEEALGVGERHVVV